MAKSYDPLKTPEYADLLKNIKKRITEAQYEALKSVNKELIVLYRVEQPGHLLPIVMHVPHERPGLP